MIEFVIFVIIVAFFHEYIAFILLGALLLWCIKNYSAFLPRSLQVCYIVCIYDEGEYIGHYGYLPRDGRREKEIVRLAFKNNPNVEILWTHTSKNRKTAYEFILWANNQVDLTRGSEWFDGGKARGLASRALRLKLKEALL